MRRMRPNQGTARYSSTTAWTSTSPAQTRTSIRMTRMTNFFDSAIGICRGDAAGTGATCPPTWSRRRRGPIVANDRPGRAHGQAQSRETSSASGIPTQSEVSIRVDRRRTPSPPSPSAPVASPRWARATERSPRGTLARAWSSARGPAGGAKPSRAPAPRTIGTTTRRWVSPRWVSRRVHQGIISAAATVGFDPVTSRSAGRGAAASPRGTLKRARACARRRGRTLAPSPSSNPPRHPPRHHPDPDTSHLPSTEEADPDLTSPLLRTSRVRRRLVSAPSSATPRWR
mmetsp:Transcript_11052/g.50075  ORF Transcript_11052/g.50075 Transcript_11052/m.50075 type:complete len:286 (+) Transcript_11052:981-1838(+)